MPSTPTLYLNGRFMPESEARISPSDRGFRFGDGVFETIRILDGHPCYLPLHLARLKAGLDALFIEADISELDDALYALIEKNQMKQGFARLAISRGEGSEGYLPSAECTEPTVLLQLSLIDADAPGIASPFAPATLWLGSLRKPSAAHYPVGCKTAQGVNSTLARIEAQKQGCDEALLLNSVGHLAEAASANLFWLKEGVLYTPAMSCGVLDGTIRRRLLEISPYKVQQVEAPLSALESAEAVVLTNVRCLVRAVNGLQPKGWQWQSDALAAELFALVLQECVPSPSGRGLG